MGVFVVVTVGVVVLVGVFVGVGVGVFVSVGVGVGVIRIFCVSTHPELSIISIEKLVRSYGSGTSKVYGNEETEATKTQIGLCKPLQ